MVVHVGKKVVPIDTHSMKNNTEQILIGDITVTLTWKSGVRAMRVRVMPPDGCVFATAPRLTTRDEMFQFLLDRYEWIVRAIEKVKSRKHSKQQNYIDGEEHLLFGIRYPLHIVEFERGRSSISFDGKIITMTVPSGTQRNKRESLMYSFYKERLSVVVAVYMRDYKAKMNCPDISFRILHRKSVWGTFNTRTHSIVYNIALAQVDLLYVQYVVLHEMVHQYVLAHNRAFYTRISALMPDWKERRTALKQFAQSNVCL